MIKKKISELTPEELHNICSYHMDHHSSCLNESTSCIKCPLWNGRCVKHLIETLNREVEIEEEKTSNSKSAVETMLSWKYNPSEIERKVEEHPLTQEEKELIKENNWKEEWR